MSVLGGFSNGACSCSCHVTQLLTFPDLTQDLEIEREATGRGLFIKRAESESKRLNPIVTRFPPSAKSRQTDY